VRGVILTGAGDKAFIAGADINELAQVTAVEAEQSSAFGQGVLILRESRKPVIAAVNGFALVAVAKPPWLARFESRGEREVRSAGSESRSHSWRRWNATSPRLVGKGRALQLILSGEIISAQEAYRIGLVNEVVPAAELITARGNDPETDLHAAAPLAVKYALEAVNKGLERAQTEGCHWRLRSRTCAGRKTEEGTQASAKRAAQFQGR